VKNNNVSANSLVFIVLTAGLILSVFAWITATNSIQREERLAFQGDAHDITRSLIRRLDTYTAILHGVQGLLSASQKVGADEWQNYIDALQLPTRYPGIQTMSFARRVPRDQKEQYEKHIRRITPPGNHDDYFVVEYVTPYTGNESTRGSDLGREPVRRAALEQARDANDAWVTGRITLAQDPTQQAALRLFLPVYRTGLPHSTIEQRRAALMGFVTMGFYINSLMDGIDSSASFQGIDIEMFDTPTRLQENQEPRVDLATLPNTTLLYDRDNNGSSPQKIGSHHHFLATLEFAGRHWALSFKSLPGYRAREENTPLIVFGVGVVITLLLSGMIWSLASSRARGWNLAQEITAELRNSEQHTRAIISNALDGIITINEQGMIASLNPAAERMFGYTAEETIGKHINILIPDAYRNQKNNFLDMLTDLKKIGNHGLQGQRKDGATFPFELGISETTLNNQRMFIGTIHDITKRKQAEHAINRFKNVLDDTLDMIFMFEPDTLRFVYLNRGAINSMGYSRQELLEMTPYQIKPLMPEQEFRALIAPLLQQEVPSLNFETLHRRKDGSDFFVEIFLQFVTTDNDTDKGLFVAIVRDITERKKIERLKNEFVSTVSHELRTPLTSIRGALGLIVGGIAGEIPAQAKKLAEIACNNSERLVRLINDILDIDKIESGKMVFDVHPVEIMPLVEEALQANQAYAEQYQVRFILDSRVPPDTKTLADHDRLTQAMANLLSNAAKFSPANDAVIISVGLQQNMIRISITDHGAGIPIEFHDRIFQKFAQADASDTRQKGGTGLGLSITKAIIEKHGGSIGYETCAGRGTTFYFDVREWKEPMAL